MLCWAAFSLQLCLMHLFLFIHSVSQSRTCWYFVKLPVSHCMLTPSYFPTLLLSHILAHTHTHLHMRTHTHTKVVLFKQLCSALCMFISAIVMVLLLSFLFCLHSFLTSPWETVGEFNSCDLVLVVTMKIVVGEEDLIFLLVCAKDTMTALISL